MKKNVTNPETKKFVLSSRERGILIALIIIMVGTIPFNWIFFLLPLLALPIALLAALVITGVIKSPIAVRTIQVLSVIGASFNLWIAGFLLNYTSS